MSAIFLATFGAVFFAEIVGDKLLYTSGVLATRFRWGAVVSGMALAFMAKMAVAVALGATVGRLLPPWLVAAVTAVSFLTIAFAMVRRPDIRTPKEKDRSVLRGAGMAFGTVLLAEWGDKGMTTAGIWAATSVSVAPRRGLSPSAVAMIVWIAAVAAIVTKGGLAVTLGSSFRAWITGRVSPERIRHGAAAALVVLGLLSILEVTGVLVE